MFTVAINLGEILTNESWAGRWFWVEGTLALVAQNELSNPDSTPMLRLQGKIAQTTWDLTWKRTKNIEFVFRDRMELAMRLCEYELVNADQVVRAVNAAICNIQSE